MWSQTVGLVNGQHKYLTAETFGFKINANGIAMKKKQQWTIEPYPLDGSFSVSHCDDLSDQEHVAIKSHLDCYLAVDSFGNVTCESRELHPGARFTVTICSMTAPGGEQIFWAFRNMDRGYFLGAQSDGMINCVAKVPQSRAELWHVHLIPARGSTMFTLRSIGRKRYARSVIPFTSSSGGGSVASGNGNGDAALSEQVQVDATSPWGPETLFQFKFYEGGKYAILTSSCKYVTSEGSCTEWTPITAKANGHSNGVSITIKSAAVVPQLPPPECLFTIEYHGGDIAFRDCNGRYLAAAGRSAVLRTRSSNVSRDELFEFEAAPIQVAFRADFNNRYVSVKQGIDLSANQADITCNYETFELEYNPQSETWNIRSKEGNYWAPGAASTIQASSRDKKTAGYFRIKWNEDGTCSILATDAAGLEGSEGSQKWVCARKSGQLCFSCTDPVGFHVMLRNRRSLNLRPSNGSGFIGLKHMGLGKLEANKTSPDSILIEYANNDDSDDVTGTFNCCYFKMSANNKYWSIVDGNTVAADSVSSTCAQQFQIELRSGSTIAIRVYESCSYLNLSKQGTLNVTNCGPNDATQWEF